MTTKSNIGKKVGLRIREYREKKKWSQECLAFESGLHRSYVGKMERGEKNITLTTLEKVAKALDSSPSELLDI